VEATWQDLVFAAAQLAVANTILRSVSGMGNGEKLTQSEKTSSSCWGAVPFVSGANCVSHCEILRMAIPS
jgi:hypothetical protein